MTHIFVSTGTFKMLLISFSPQHFLAQFTFVQVLLYCSILLLTLQKLYFNTQCWSGRSSVDRVFSVIVCVVCADERVSPSGEVTTTSVLGEQ